MNNIAAENKFVIGLGITDLEQLTMLETRLKEIQARFGGAKQQGATPGKYTKETSQMARAMGTLQVSSKKVAGSQAQFGKEVKNASMQVRGYQKNLNNLIDTQKHLAQAGRKYPFTTQFGIATTMGRNEFSDLIRRVTLWSGAVALMFGTLAKLKQGIELTRDLEMTMIEFQKVMSSNTPFNVLKRNLLLVSHCYCLV